jgi:hypothetical protein
MLAPTVFEKKGHNFTRRIFAFTASIADKADSFIQIVGFKQQET